MDDLQENIKELEARIIVLEERANTLQELVLDIGELFKKSLLLDIESMTKLASKKK